VKNGRLVVANFPLCLLRRGSGESLISGGRGKPDNAANGPDFHFPMRTYPTDAKRLELLNQMSPTRSWRSVKEKRRCVVCEKVFRGGDAIVRWRRQGLISLECPGCASAPSTWVRLGNPLIDELAWQEWEAAMASCQSRFEADREDQLVG